MLMTMSTKVHLASDSRARPLSIHVTAGQAGDAPAFEAVMAGIRIPRSGLGRPRTRPAVVLADRAYSSRAIRGHLRRRGIRAVIPQPADQIGHRLRRGRAGGRPPGFDAETYKERNAVERCIARLKQWTCMIRMSWLSITSDMPPVSIVSDHASRFRPNHSGSPHGSLTASQKSLSVSISRPRRSTISSLSVIAAD